MSAIKSIVMNAAHGWTGRKAIRMADDRLISLNAAIDAFKKALTVGEWKGNYVTIRSAIGYEGAKHILESLPTVDAVPVVRCKDCIRFSPDDDVWGWCTVSGKMRCKDYCSYGVREDGEQHG